MKTKAAFALGAALLVGLPAFAQQSAAPAQQNAAPAQQGQAQAQGQRQGPRGMERMFEQFDTNGDGRVTFDEAWGVVTQRFTQADADRSGGLSQAEFANLRAPRPEGARQPSPERAERMQRGRAAMFRALDANSDGQVTLEEMRVPASARFRALDANSDGAVTREELPRWRHGHHHRGERGERAPAAPASPSAPATR